MTIDTNLAHSVVIIIKNESDQIIGYELDNGERISTSEAVEYAKQGVLKDVEISTSKNGEECLKCLSEGEQNAASSNLPITIIKSDKVDFYQYFQ